MMTIISTFKSFVVIIFILSFSLVDLFSFPVEISCKALEIDRIETLTEQRCATSS